MVAYFCLHLSDNYVDFSDIYVALQIFMLTCQIFMLTNHLLICWRLNPKNVFLFSLCHTVNNKIILQVDKIHDKSTKKSEKSLSDKLR